MYPIPDEKELDFLIELEVIGITFFQYTTIILLADSSIAINGYKENFTAVGSLNNDVPLNECLDDIISHKIISLENDENKRLNLILDNQWKISLSTEDEMYECFTISSPKGTIVV